MSVIRRGILIGLLFCIFINGYSQEDLLLKFTNSVVERLNFSETSCDTSNKQAVRENANRLLRISGLANFHVLCFSHALDNMNFAAEWEANAEWEDTFYATSRWLTNDKKEFARSYQFTNAEYELDNVPYVVVVNFTSNMRNQSLYVLFQEDVSTTNSNNATSARLHVIPDMPIGVTGLHLEDIRTFWTYNRNLLGNDSLVAPEVRFEVTNRGSRAASYLKLKAVFYAKGDNGLLELFDENEEYVIATDDTPLKPYVQKTEWLTSGVGYSVNSSLIFQINAGNAPEMFAVLYYKLGYGDNWHEIGEVTIDSTFVR